MLEEHGYSVEIVQYSRNTLVEATTIGEIADSLVCRKYFNKMPFYLRYMAALILYPSVHRLKKSFNAFSRNRFHISSNYYLNEKELKDLPPTADVYCTGGDQMWNEQHNGHKTLREFYLTWAPIDKMRISLFTSIGKTGFDEWEKDEVAELLSDYQLISVREDSGKKAIEELGLRNVYHLQDPTILLDVAEWKSLSAPRHIKERYILLYEISRSAPLEKYAKELKKRTGLKVFRINYYYFDSYKYGKSIIAPTLEQFLSLFQYADYVITNSFHGTAFSIAFGRKFATVAGANPGRLQSVLAYYGMENRMCMKPSEIYDVINEPINQEEVSTRLAFAREDFEEYMNKLAVLLKE